MYNKDYLKAYDTGVTDAKSIAFLKESTPAAERIFKGAVALRVRNTILGDLTESEKGYLEGFSDVMNDAYDHEGDQSSFEASSLHHQCTCEDDSCDTEPEQEESHDPAQQAEYDAGVKDGIADGKLLLNEPNTNGHTFERFQQIKEKTFSLLRKEAEGSLTAGELGYLDGFDSVAQEEISPEERQLVDFLKGVLSSVVHR